ncbi:hypothetical protein BYT27DRAFT_7194473 [Phlegmacium glaucopus]|nr:hypothetical protein BYT27DRAFT_7194473 [Phlegmacium glaucopus]
MNQFDVAKYNSLLPVGDADTLFNEQLNSAGITRRQLFSQLAPLFSEGENAGRYGTCLVHRHYLLMDGERMVTTNNSTMPTLDASVNIVADRWYSTGGEFEHRFTDNPTSLPPPPSADFFDKFRSIINANGIDILGVCYAPAVGELAPGFIFLEGGGAQDREQVLTVIPTSSRPYGGYEASWVPRDDPDDPIFIGCCCSVCNPSPPCKLARVSMGTIFQPPLFTVKIDEETIIKQFEITISSAISSEYT